MGEKSTFVIESRVQLVSALAEAAEIEHNLMCLYLYAMFSLKRRESEGVTRTELEGIERWRKVVLGVALEEMTHLTLVSNLTTAIGGTPHFMRPNFPSYPGLYPAGIVVELAPFDLKTLDHFIYLERPHTKAVSDGAGFVARENYVRLSEKNRLMPTSGDYQTVGALYLSIRGAFESLCAESGENNIFVGNKAQQIGPLDSPLPGLTVVGSKEEALKAIDTIITQGEGASDDPNSHFVRFSKIKEEYESLLKLNSNFSPARPVARNPVMRKPLNPNDRIWVRDKLAVQYLDVANALYAMMLRVLVQVYAVEDRPSDAKQTLLNLSYTLMHAMATVAETLTHLPVGPEHPDVLSGMSFAMVRTLSPLQRQTEKPLLVERMGQAVVSLERLQNDLESERETRPHVAACIEELRKVTQSLRLSEPQIRNMPVGTLTSPAEKFAGASSFEKKTESPKESAKTKATDVSKTEICESEKIRLIFDAKKCIHSRHCVTELPHVFKANTPGKWIFPENTESETLAAVARECPSGAIRYERKDSAPNETAPKVNLARLRENGPYAFLGQLEIDGKQEGMRATLCRCGQSKNKPFCDGSHVEKSFSASGEPPTMDATALSQRDGLLQVRRTHNGPLEVKGNLEICAGTGRIVLRAQSVRLCRCGQSKNKPLCDNSHVAAGFLDEVK